MNAAGGDQRRLTHDSGRNGIFDSLPLWSPRGDLIAFQKSVNGQSVDLWVVRSDGSDARHLTADGGTKRSVSWSPDGMRLHTHAPTRPGAASTQSGSTARRRPPSQRPGRTIRSRVVAGRIPDRVQRAGLDRDRRGRIGPADRDPDRIRDAGLVARRQPDRVHGLPLVSPVRQVASAFPAARTSSSSTRTAPTSAASPARSTTTSSRARAAPSRRGGPTAPGSSTSASATHRPGSSR